MAWDYKIDKVNEISSAIKKALKEYMENTKVGEVERIINLFEKVTIPVRKGVVSSSSALFPLEVPREYPLIKPFKDIPEAVEYLRKSNVSIGAIDSSFFNPGPHVLVPITVISVGFWYHNYVSGKNGFGIKADAEPIVENRIKLQLRTRDLEKEVVEAVIGRLDGDVKVLLLDESLNMSYTLAWASSMRKEMVMKTNAIIRTCIEEDVIPVGIFYTNARDITKGLAEINNIPHDVLPPVSDRTLMNIYLKNRGSRSPVFEVFSRAIADYKELELVSFYLKIGDRNVVRVEFPEEYKDLASDIQAIIYAQAVLGGGYPLALQRAHEAAVISKDERVVIEDLIANFLKRPSVEYILSKKASSKRWPLA
ncbi:MAG: DNA double-strand break repair nuclease NurA [Candidatus Njordarchaeales archaeon]